MAIQDFFAPKERVARELAEYETANSPLGQSTQSPEEYEELVQCAQMYLQDTYSKDLIVSYLDAFYHR